MNIVFVLIFGLIVGSFLNVCIFRIPREESVVFPPSHCTNCNIKIKCYYLIPVLSYIILKGKCKNCGDKISIIYTIVEILNGVLWVIVYTNYGYTLNFFKYIFFISFFIVVSLIDYKTQNIYFNTTVTGIAAALVFILLEIISLNNLSVCLNYVYGAAFAGGIIAFIIFITKGMGWGDVEMCFVSGLFLGLSKSIFMVLCAFVIGGIFGILLLNFNIKKKKDAVPFVPFIGAASIIAGIYGEHIVKWYLKTIIFI